MNETKSHKSSELDAPPGTKLVYDNRSYQVFELDAPPGTKPSRENEEALVSRKTIGAFLRQEREKKGLSYEQISEITKLRPPILKALENESWDSLSSPVFAGGFIRSYGKALGLEEEKVMALFNETKPVTDSTPKPLVEPVRRKKTFLVFLLFVLLAFIPAYFLWEGYSSHRKIFVRQATSDQIGDKTDKSEKIRRIHSENEGSTPIEKPQSNPAPETDLQTRSMTQSESPPEKDAESVNDSHMVTPFDGIETPELVLKADFRDMTWLRIFIDDEDAREYIFRPDEHFEWKAKKGFELLIGNAAGIDLELNGKKIEGFGTPGQVLSLKLPKGYERRHLPE